MTAKQGEYGNTDYGVRYARSADNKPYFSYDNSQGQTYRFTRGAWREFLGEVKKAMPKKFLVSMNADRSNRSAPWFMDSRVDRAKIDAVIAAMGAPASEITKSSQRAAPKTPAFKRWFGDSQVVDADGKPLVVCHCSRSSFDTFNLSKVGGHR